MQCIRPLNASWDNTGNVTFKNKDLMKGITPFKVPCRKCIPCLLNMSREKAVRALHETQTREDSIFLTLTYNDESIPSSGELNYPDFQLFMRKLRKKAKSEQQINSVSYMVTGEYGEETKRPHWHAIIFGYRPLDAKHQYSNGRGDYVFGSESLSKLWGHGFISFGAVTLESASYVARYGAKALGHKDHKYKPKHVTSCRPGLGLNWIKKHWKHTFENGFVVVDGKKFGIPRYYEDWFKKDKPLQWQKYRYTIKDKQMKDAEEHQRKEEYDYLSHIWSLPHGHPYVETRNEVKNKIISRKFKRLKEKQSL